MENKDKKRNLDFSNEIWDLTETSDDDKTKFASFVTIDQLNNEARVRADSDQKIMNEFKILEKTQNSIIDGINIKVNKIDYNLLLEKIKTVEDTIKDHQNKIFDLETNLNKWDFEKKKLDQFYQEKISNLETEKIQLGKQLKEITNLYNKRKMIIEDLEAKKELLQKQLDDANKTINNKQLEIEDLNIVIKDLVAKKEVLQKQLDDANNNIIAKDDEIEKLKELINEDKNFQEIKKLNKQIEQLTNEKNHLVNQLIKINNQISELENLINKLNNQLAKKDGEINQLEIERENLKYQLNASNKLINDYQIVIKNLNHEIENLESKKEVLQKQLDDANNIIIEKDDEIKKLNKQIEQLNSEKSKLANNLVELNKQISQLKETNNKLDYEKELFKKHLKNIENKYINLEFNATPEFTINEIITVKNFINRYLKELIVSKMKVKYPNAEWNKDYSIKINNLNYYDMIQGNNLTVVIKAEGKSELTGQGTFKIKINYNYNISTQADFLDCFFYPAIPISLRNVAEKVYPNYNIPEEIVNTKPLKLLINNEVVKNLTFKIFAEMNAASYWTDFHRSWQYIKSGYVGTGKSTIGTDKIINNINNLYNSTLNYYDYIFIIIENHLKNSGVNCKITKKWVHNTLGNWLLHTLGNLTFNVFDSNSDNAKVIGSSRNYYMMINFEVDAKNFQKFYRGVTLFMSDNLEFYLN